MKVSIIIPVYNIENYLSKCLDSVINQNFNDYEIIIINDGSTDNSSKIISDYQKKFPNKIVSIDKQNEGQAIARNIGIQKARGKYIMFVDGDDYIDENTLRICYDEAQKKEADIVCFGHHMVIDGKIYTTENSKMIVEDVVKDFILRQMGPCEKFIKRSLIIENNLYFPKLRAYEDIAVIPAYAIYTNKIVNIDEGLYYYLLRTGSTMNQTVYSKKLEHIFDAMNNLYELFEKSNKLNQYYDEIEFLFIKHLLHGAGLRFIKFDNYLNNLNQIIKIMQIRFPKWTKNKYFKKESLKYKIMCKLIYKKKIKLIKKLKKR